MISSLLLSAAPLMLASLGALWTECAGVLSIAIEAWMISGAFTAYCFSLWTGSIPAALFLAALFTAFTGWAAMLFIEKSGADAFIVALALNLGVAGAVPLISARLFGTSGVLRSAKLSVPAHTAFPFFENGVSPFVLLALFCALLSALIIRKTPFGLRLCASGLSRAVAFERGINTGRYRRLSWAIAAFLSALGGAALMFRTAVYAPQSVAGRGWLAVAAVFLGFRTVRGVCIAALVFAAADRLLIQAQVYSAIPATALIGLPSALALILYAAAEFIAKKRRGEGFLLAGIRKPGRDLHGGQEKN
ncbi:MAG: ABC transporter permease [Spirochaetaceae bacterium]|jgi:simple sugar transport system permease protein|nr:ABC transporter permease [Spirochaetaceae bacterium]